MYRILAAMSLVGAGPCNVFGPGMSAGALESFARDAGRAKAAEGNSRGAAAGGTRSASLGSCGKCAAESKCEKEANSGANANVTRSCPCPALDDQRFYFVDAVVAPY